MVRRGGELWGGGIGNDIGCSGGSGAWGVVGKKMRCVGSGVKWREAE